MTTAANMLHWESQLGQKQQVRLTADSEVEAGQVRKVGFS